MNYEQRIHRLAAAIRCFTTEGHPLREQLCRETPHMAPEVMAAGLDISLEGWDEAGIASLYSEEQPYMQEGVAPNLVAIVLAGVLPPSHVQAFAYPYLLGAELLVQHPSRDALFPTLFAEALGEHVTLMDRLGFGGVLERADAVIAIGDDESVNAIRNEVAVATPFMGFGHRSAVSIVMGSSMARSPAVAADIARDICSFDQLGCLSPREIFVLGDIHDAHALAAELAQIFHSLPRRMHLGIAIEGAIRGVRESANVMGETVYGPDDLQWGVITSTKPMWSGTPGGRHVVVRSVSSISAAVEALSPLKGHLSAVGIAGGELDVGTRRALVRLGASRIVPVGKLQAAPPTWPHDGRRPLASLCRWCGKG